MPRYENFNSGFEHNHPRPGIEQKVAQEEQEKEDPRPILVDGHIRGLEYDRIQLLDFSETTSFQECYFSTDSGNIYAFFKYPSGEIVLADARSNLGKGAGLTGARISHEDLEKAAVEVGRPLRLHNSKTTSVRQIVVVTDSYFSTAELDHEQSHKVAEEHSEGRSSNIRRQFREIVFAGQ